MIMKVAMILTKDMAMLCSKENLILLLLIFLDPFPLVFHIYFRREERSSLFGWEMKSSLFRAAEWHSAKENVQENKKAAHL